jgi:hypothetical protein
VKKQAWAYNKWALHELNELYFGPMS